MPSQSIQLRVPDELYDRLKKRAARAQRSIETELLDVITAAVESPGELPNDLAEALEPLAVLDDEALWRAARSHLDARLATELELLNVQQQGEGLLPSDDQRRLLLLRQYERAMLVRAQAAALLKERGHAVAQLLQ
ncbi:MAG TPA: Arc family DNA-binding protein [Chloroflexota bacterium]